MNAHEKTVLETIAEVAGDKPHGPRLTEHEALRYIEGLARGLLSRARSESNAGDS